MYNYITLKELRPQLPKVIDQVDSRLDRYVVSRHGNPIAILLAFDDFESLVETLNEVEDRENLKKIRKGLREAKKGRTVSWKAVKAKYHL
ncbi:MAG: type II toxin-antitoxin system Phd/YefM family antitoxin [Deltaproteobacteria bacterium]|nr:type II toxin-antitoxin system Phd/YefM family antitoxin [Deltaproteobacteria bacterium]MBI4374337.1 type II toxin-antitoxin system Phd/YefM family antitoxin [Deltaproteobacteria bacterium]